MEYLSEIRRILSLALVLGMITQGVAESSILTVAPADAVHGLGENAQFFCKISADPKNEAIEWTRTLRDSTKESIYKTFKPKELDHTKYNFTLTAPLESNIVVKNIGYPDVGRYRCQPMSETVKGKDAFLVVVGKPVISISSPLLANKQAMLTCDIYYSGSGKFSEANVEPELIAMIGPDRITSVKLEITQPNTPDETTRARLDYNVTLAASHDGLNFSCGARVQRQNPTRVDFEISTARMLSVAFAVHNVKITEKREFYYPNDLINCTAEGNPEPEISWIPIQSEGAGGLHHGGVLTVDEQMLGQNEWKCRAENTAGGIPYVEETPSIFFEVLSPTEPPTGESTGGDVTTIIIAVVVPVGVILIIVIVICIVCARKKKGSAKPKATEASETGAASARQRNQIYKPVSTKGEGQVSFQDELAASYKVKEKTSKPTAAPRKEESKKEPAEEA